MTYDLEKFVKSQNAGYGGYEMALDEIKRGKKQSHWIWYIFPQLKQLGRSSTAQYFGIDDIHEATAYLSHPILGARLIEISQALLDLDETDPVKILGHTDAMKVKSCMTLFLQIQPENKVLRAVIDKYYNGQLDNKTLSYLIYGDQQ